MVDFDICFEALTCCGSQADCMTFRDIKDRCNLS